MELSEVDRLAKAFFEKMAIQEGAMPLADLAEYLLADWQWEPKPLEIIYCGDGSSPVRYYQFWRSNAPGGEGAWWVLGADGVTWGCGETPQDALDALPPNADLRLPLLGRGGKIMEKTPAQQRQDKVDALVLAHLQANAGSDVAALKAALGVGARGWTNGLEHYEIAGSLQRLLRRGKVTRQEDGFDGWCYFASAEQN